MSVATVNDYASVLDKVRSWPAEMRLSLAEEVLHSLRTELGTNGKQGIPAEQVRGIGDGKGPPPDDNTVREWIDRHRTEKYG